MDKDLKHFKNIIESKGHLFTRQKQSILQVLVESDIHLSAAEIQKNSMKIRPVLPLFTEA